MKRIVSLVILFAVCFSVFGVASAEWVNGYFRADGTWVNGYYRSDRNSTELDNYSYRRYIPRTYTPRTYSTIDSHLNRGYLPSYSSTYRPLYLGDY